MLEKDEVARLRSIVNHLEIEKAEFRKRMGDLESEATHVYRENEKIMTNLQTKNNEASVLDSDNRSLNDRIRQMAA
jgi:hypothetical protein